MHIIKRIIRVFIIAVCLLAGAVVLINLIGLITNLIAGPRLTKLRSAVLDSLERMETGYTKSLVIYEAHLTEGNAYDYYAEAIEDDIDGFEQTMVRHYLQTGRADLRDSVIRIAAERRQALAKIKMGIETKACSIPFDYRAGYDAELPPFVKLKNYCELMLAAGKADHDRDQGLTTILSAFVLGIDIGQGFETLINKMVSYVLIGQTMAVMTEEISEHDMNTPDLDRILEVLTAVHGQIPPLYTAAEMEWRSIALTPADKAYWMFIAGDTKMNFLDFLLLRASSFKYLFSEKWMFLDALNRYHFVAQKVKETEGLSWNKAQPTWTAIEEECKKSANIMVRVAVPSYSSMIQRKCKLVANLRLLISAIHVLEYEKKHGTVPDNLGTVIAETDLRTDPFNGEEFRYRPEEDMKHFIIYSVGKNLTDDNGIQDDCVIKI